MVRVKGWSGASAVTTLLRVSVARSASRLWKLCTGNHRPRCDRWFVAHGLGRAPVLWRRCCRERLPPRPCRHRRRAWARGGRASAIRRGRRACTGRRGRARGRPASGRWARLNGPGLQAAEGALDKPMTCRRAPLRRHRGYRRAGWRDHVDAVGEAHRPAIAFVLRAKRKLSSVMARSKCRSERPDSNRRPLDPQSSALPSCATLRRRRLYRQARTRRNQAREWPKCLRRAAAALAPVAR